MVSSKTATGFYEIWLFSEEHDYREPVVECGRFRSRHAAELMASRLRAWLHLDIRCDNLFDNTRRRRDRLALLDLHTYLNDLGVDPARCLVQAVEAGRVPDSQVTLRLFDPNSRGL